MFPHLPMKIFNITSKLPGASIKLRPSNDDNLKYYNLANADTPNIIMLLKKIISYSATDFLTLVMSANYDHALCKAFSFLP